jgi:hypothetical protein
MIANFFGARIATYIRRKLSTPLYCLFIYVAEFRAQRPRHSLIHQFLWEAQQIKKAEKASKTPPHAPLKNKSTHAWTPGSPPKFNARSVEKS